MPKERVIVKAEPERTRTGIVHKFTSSELHALRGDLVTSLNQVEELEKERKAAMAEHKSAIEKAEAEVARIKNACSRGEEDRFPEVMLARNFETGEREYWSFKDDGRINQYGGRGSLVKVLKKEPLNASDRRLEQELIDAENARREAEAEEQLGSDDDTADDS